MKVIICDDCLKKEDCKTYDQYMRGLDFAPQACLMREVDESDKVVKKSLELDQKLAR